MIGRRLSRYNGGMSEPVVANDSFLTINYRLALPGGEDYINTFADRPATMQLGTGQFAPCFEKVLIGAKVGEKRVAVLAPAEAFGEHKLELVQWITMETLQANTDEVAEFAPGDMIEFNAPSGAQYAGVLQSINEEGAWFDFNHPLAGKQLSFEVEIIAIL
jgi:FKBP-type peptidyl-prolyl cis-trans isomerase SlpA